MLNRLRRIFGCSVYRQKGEDPDATNGITPQQQQRASVLQAAHTALKERLDGLLADDQAGLSQEYNSLQDCNSMETSETAESQVNASKNRYVNVLPFDYNRVRISGKDDYINASLLHVRLSQCCSALGLHSSFCACDSQCFSLIAE